MLNFNSNVKKELDAFFGKINSKYQEKGMEWSVGEGHYYIELKIGQSNQKDQLKTAVNTGGTGNF